MQRRGPVLLQSLCMFGREIALMAGQAVLREDLIPDPYALVAPDFGDDGGGSDGVALRVALDQGTLGSGERQRHGVNQQKIRCGRQACDRHFHGHLGGLVNVDPVDGGRIHGRYRPSHRALADALGEHGAALGVELFAVVQAAHRAVRRKDYRGGHHRPEQSATADFIHTSHGLESARAEFTLQRSLAAEMSDLLCGPHEERVLEDPRRTGVLPHTTHVRGGVRLCPSVRANSKAEDLVLAAPHTHHGPANFASAEVYNSFAGPLPHFDPALLDFLAARIADAVVDSIADARTHAGHSHELRFYRGSAPGIQRNRAIAPFFNNPEALRSAIFERSRSLGATCPDGTTLGCPRYLAADPTLQIVEILRDGTPRAMLLFFAVHPTAITHDADLYSSDLTGIACATLENPPGTDKTAMDFRRSLPETRWQSCLSPVPATGSPDRFLDPIVGFFNGAEGDISPDWLVQ